MINRINTGAGETVSIDVTTPAIDRTFINEATVSTVQIGQNAVDNTDSVETLVSNDTAPEPGSGSSSGSLGLLSLIILSLTGLLRYNRA